jgi:predicted ribosomally synthesized peptide with nif11-like leader
LESFDAGAMSDDQLKVFLEAVRADAALQEKLKGAADLDDAVAIAKEAGFYVTNEDWLKYQANQTVELSDVELESLSGGITPIWAAVGAMDGQVIWLTTGLAGDGDFQSAAEIAKKSGRW